MRGEIGRQVFFIQSVSQYGYPVSGSQAYENWFFARSFHHFLGHGGEGLYVPGEKLDIPVSFMLERCAVIHVLFRSGCQSDM